jgi:DNA-binding response OmpR family regulator
VSGQTQVAVFQYREPRQKLMAWFLIDSGIPACVVRTSEEAVALLTAGGIRVLVVNTTAPVADVAEIVKTMRVTNDAVRIIVLHRSKHREGDPEIPADACIHDVNDPDALVETVRAALADDIPDIEPHEAAEEVIEDAAGGGS